MDWLTQDEAAAAIGLSVRRLQQLRNEGVITAQKHPVTRAVRYADAEVARFIEARDAAWKSAERAEG
jgi:hypothetical protein